MRQYISIALQGGIYRSRNKNCIIAMGCVIVAAVENSYSFGVLLGQTAEKLDEAIFIVDFELWP
jgi:hypothetical protein